MTFFHGTGFWRWIASLVIMLTASIPVSSNATAAQAEVASAGATTPVLTAADLDRWLGAYVPKLLKDHDVAGAVLVVVKDGRVFFQKGYGHADLAAGTPMDPERSGVGIGSVSKLFTWTAVMQLVERGKLDLDRDINDYLDFRIARPFGKPITLRHLMTHTPGFGERQKEFVGPGDPPHSLGDYMRTVPPPDLLYPPGTVPAYSNYGTPLAGYIVERAAGEPFETYVARNILQPLGMTRSNFCKPLPRALAAGMAKAYGTASARDLVPPGANSRDPRCDPAGDLVSTAGDMARFMLAHLGRGRFGDVQLLRPETADRMHDVAFVPMPGALGTALGFFRGDYNGRRIILHDGDLTGFHSDLQLVPEENLGFFLSVNSDGAGGLIGGAYRLRAALFHAFMDRYFPAPARAPQPTLATAKDHARLAAGEYEMSRPRAKDNFMRAIYLATHLTIKANPDGTIETPAFLSLKSGRPQTWREVEPFIWQEVGGKDRLAMKVKDGRVQAWVPGAFTGFVMLPVPWWASGAVNLPLFGASVALLLVAGIAWPIATFVRRRAGRTIDDKKERRLAALAYGGAVAAIVSLLGWVALFMGVAAGSTPNVSLDPWIRVIQLIGLLAVVGAVAALWQAWRVCTGPTRWWVRLWTILLALALVDFAWFSLAFGLISPGLNY